MFVVVRGCGAVGAQDAIVLGGPLGVGLCK
jgi:hypothetical protein